MIQNDKKALSLYIHIPFCVRKCIYCDFLSEPLCGHDHKRVSEYVDALCSELLSYKDIADRYIVETIFIGGGTPSLVDEAYILQIMQTVREVFAISGDAEITIEANPGTITRSKLDTYKACGINRLSIGLQSANDDELKLLGRIHNFDQFLAGYDMAREAGFRNINIDIMSGLPGQSLHSYLETIERVLRLSPEHISSYGLIVEEGTPLYDNRELLDTLPDEETDRRMYKATGRILEMAGYHRYEISNYALPGRECRHNIVYWRLKEYLGFGVGAASYFRGARFTNTDDMDIYNKKPVRYIDETVDADRLMEEYMFLGLRVTQGVSAAEFYDYFGRSIYDIYGDVIDRYKGLGLLKDDSGMVSLTGQGIDVSNVILADFLL